LRTFIKGEREKAWQPPRGKNGTSGKKGNTELTGLDEGKDSTLDKKLNGPGWVLEKDKGRARGGKGANIRSFKREETVNNAEKKTIVVER